MRPSIRMALSVTGVLACLTGAVFFLQGVGILGGSFMSSTIHVDGDRGPHGGRRGRAAVAREAEHHSARGPLRLTGIAGGAGQADGPGASPRPGPRTTAARDRRAP